MRFFLTGRSSNEKDIATYEERDDDVRGGKREASYSSEVWYVIYNR